MCCMLGLTACASLPQPQQLNLQSDDPLTRSCAELLDSLDELVNQAKVADLGARRSEGFPYLRTNRFLASFSDELDDDLILRNAWLQEMQQLDLQGRQFELLNTSRQLLDGSGFADTAAVLEKIKQCGDHLLKVDQQYPSRMELLRSQAEVVDDYSNTKRIFGLYALTRYPFYWGVEEWQQDVKASFDVARQQNRDPSTLVYYAPPRRSVLTKYQVQQLLERANQHPLGIPQLSPAERQDLFATFAPVYEVETVGDYDRIGAPNWSMPAYPTVDIDRPVVFTRIEHTRYQQQTLLQLVYTVWMPERPRQHFLDLLGGNLDGLVWRVTLAPDGEPILYDSIHPCGCYHKFFPTARLQPLDKPGSALEWLFIPAELPALAHAERLTLSLQSRTHYLQNVWPKPAIGETETYRFADYDELRSLPTVDGGYRSLFGPDGLVAGTERRERFLFWPMGIKSAGAMRQAGSQPTAFAGRRHFDDADLIEQRFRLLPVSDTKN